MTCTTNFRTKEAMSSKRYVRRIGLHHFAHLRAVAEGLPLIDCAQRYLGIEHGHQAQTAHRQVIEAIRAVARRSGESAWRLVGLTIHTLPNTTGAQPPSLDDFIAQRDLDGWSEAEVAQMYADAYPVDHKAMRRARLRQRQMELLHRLERLAAERPAATDLVTGWFDDSTTQRLLGAGINTLGDLHQRIHLGGRWFSTMPGVGITKARRIASHLANLLPDLPQPAKVLFTLAKNSPSESPRFDKQVTVDTDVAPLSFSGSEARYSSDLALTNPPNTLPALVSARSDLEAVEAWITARSGSAATDKVYRREAQRLLLWLQHERVGKRFSQMDVGDCNGYQAFLAAIPAHWIARVRAQPGQPGWTPFRGQLSPLSRQQAITIVASLFGWLQSARYLQGNPWVLVNTKLGDDKDHKLLDSKALSEAAMQEFLDYIEAQPPSPSRHRIRFILRFVESVGLRSAELLGATLGDFQHEPEGWMLQVHGKGAKNRIAAIPMQALHALEDYLYHRGIGSLDTAPTDAPLLASTLDPMEPIGYQALYEHVRGWISKAVSASVLPTKERLTLARASTHWLRHTFGTRSIARGVPLDVIQAQMGHASVQTTTSIYGRAPIQRRAEELGKAFGNSESRSG